MSASRSMLLLLALFFCSGACGLAYQVLWLRQLSLVFGVTAYAASTVLAAFMAGLALGSWLAGPLLTRWRRPLAAFGLAEILIGLSALATPWALGLASAIYRQLYAVAPDAFALQTFARFACAFVVLLVPTALMGMTLPLLSASSLVRGPRFASRVSAFYAANTAGAVIGALLTGFVLIGGVGIHRTFLLAAAANIVIGVSALFVDRRISDASVEVLEAPADRRADLPRSPGSRLAWAIMGLSGFGALALEIVWFRLMMQHVDASTYAFTSVLAVVLAGIALGGAVSSRVLAREHDWLAWLAVVQVLTAVLVILGAGIMSWSDGGALDGMRAMRRVMLGVFLPAVLMGVSFPLLLRVGVPPAHDAAADGAARGRLIGRFYGVNVLGAILGALAGGFLLLPFLGTEYALIMLAAVFLASGVAISLTHPRRPRTMAVAAIGLVVFVLSANALPDPIAAAARRRVEPSAVEIFRDEGVQTAVSVHATGFQRTLRVGGLHQANDSAGMIRLHRGIGLLPMALHPAPKSALVIGLGGGATAGAVSQHAGVSVQIVELSDSVRRAAAFFAHVNYDVLNRSNVRVRVDDGRNFLLLSGERFDVVTADIIQPVHAGAGALYSREYFELVRNALNPGGLVLQWVGQRPAAHYTLIMRTFLTVFPHATLWLDGQFMVGSMEPLKIGEAAFSAKLADPETRAAFADVGLDSYAALRSWYTTGPAGMAAIVGRGEILTDDLPLVEYHRSIRDAGGPLDVSPFRGDVREIESR